MLAATWTSGPSFATAKRTFLSRPMAMIVVSTLARKQDVLQGVGQ